jgi:zinc and cadmium transporter
MSDFILALISSVFVSLISILIIVFYRFNLSNFLSYIVYFCAGSLISTSLFYLLNEGLLISKNFILVSIYFLGGFLFLLVLEKFLVLHHYYKKSSNLYSLNDETKFATPYILLLGDFFHNFLDGLAIGTAFAINTNFGFITTFSILLHEIPEEFSHVSLLLHFGWTKKKAILLNFLVSLTSILGAIFGFYFSKQFDFVKVLFLSITAGQLFYIASVDLLPFLLKEKSPHSFFGILLLF